MKNMLLMATTCLVLASPAFAMDDEVEVVAHLLNAKTSFNEDNKCQSRALKGEFICPQGTQHDPEQRTLSFKVSRKELTKFSQSKNSNYKFEATYFADAYAQPPHHCTYGSVLVDYKFCVDLSASDVLKAQQVHAELLSYTIKVPHGDSEEHPVRGMTAMMDPINGPCNSYVFSYARTIR